MAKLVKSSKYLRDLSVFPDSDGPFDSEACEGLREIILREAEAMPALTRQGLAKRLGIVRDRLSRLLLALDITNDFAAMQARKQRARQLSNNCGSAQKTA